MLKDNVARVIKEEQPVGISILGPGAAAGWETWIQNVGFKLVRQEDVEDADVLMWVDPESHDFSAIAADPRCIVVGDQKNKDFCQEKNIAYVKEVENSEAIQRQLENFARKVRETMENASPTGSHSITVPPTLSTQPPLKERNVKLQRGLKKRILPASVLPQEAEKVDPPQIEQRKEIVVALTPMADGVGRFKKFIHEKSDGEYRVLEVAETFADLSRIVDKGFFEVILIHRDLLGLQNNLVENLKLIREKAPDTRIIFIERKPDEYSEMYKSHLKAQAIEWHVIPILPGHLMNILKSYRENPVLFDWDEEDQPASNLPAVRTKVLSPILIAFHSAGGGVGKSTGSTQMGFTFAEMGYKTLVIELDTEKPSLLRAVGASEDCPGLAAWNTSDFKNESTAIEAIHRTSRQVRGLYVLPVGPISPKKVVLPFHLEAVGDKKTDPCDQANVFYRAALREFQIVIVDTNTSLIDPPVYSALIMAKRVFYVMEATKVFLDSAEAHFEQAYDLGIELSNYRIVLNKCTSNDPVSLRVITQTLELPVSHQVPLDVEGYRLAAHHGRAYKPKKGTSPWKEFCEMVLQDLEVPINTTKVKKMPLTSFSLRNLLFKWRKKS